MPAGILENDQMCYNLERGVPWHGMGIPVQGVMTSQEALEKSGLIWNVSKRQMWFPKNQIDMNELRKLVLKGATQDELLQTLAMPADNLRALVRDDTQYLLGSATEDYAVLQSAIAFDWTDMLIGEGVRYETAGSLWNGKVIWILAVLPGQYKILGDDVVRYIMLTTGHDGKHCTRVASTPERVVCWNTLNIALDVADRTWAVRHTGSIYDKLEAARETLGLADRYYANLAEAAEKMADLRVNVESLVGKLIGDPRTDSKVVVQRTDAKKNAILQACNAPDLVQFKDTAWAFINGVSDFATHATPDRKTAQFKEKRLEGAWEGYDLIDKAVDLVRKEYKLVA